MFSGVKSPVSGGTSGLRRNTARTLRGPDMVRLQLVLIEEAQSPSQFTKAVPAGTTASSDTLIGETNACSQLPVQLLIDGPAVICTVPSPSPCRITLSTPWA